MVLEYITCIRCKKQQPKDNFWYSATRHTICKFCNKKTNIIPPKYEVKTADVISYLSDIVFDPKNDTSIAFQMQIDKVFIFLKRLECKEMERLK